MKSVGLTYALFDFPSNAGYLEKNLIRKPVMILSLFMLSSAAFAFSAEEVGTLRYAVCEKNVKQVDIRHDEDRYYVMIRLTETASREFAILTTNNINKRLTVIAGDIVVLSALIKDTIDSGVILSLPMNEQAALKLQQFILGNEESQCGLIK